MRNGRRDHAPMRRPPDPRTIPYPRRALACASIVLVLLSEASYVSARVNEATKTLPSVPSSEPKVKTPAATHRTVYTSDTSDGTIVPNYHGIPITPRMRHRPPSRLRLNPSPNHPPGHAPQVRHQRIRAEVDPNSRRTPCLRAPYPSRKRRACPCRSRPHRHHPSRGPSSCRPRLQPQSQSSSPTAPTVR